MELIGLKTVADELQRSDVPRKADRNNGWSFRKTGTTLIFIVVIASLSIRLYGPGIGCELGRNTTCSTDRSAERVSLFALSPDTDPVLDLMLLRWQPPGYPPLNFTNPASRAAIQWPTNTPVVVPAVYKDFDKFLPLWLFRWPTFVYQRQRPEKPLFCPNFGCEGGVYLQFIVDFYDNLPDRTAFVQGMPNGHNEQWEDMLRCLKPEINFTTLAPWIVMTKTPAQVAEGFDESLLNCVQNTARAFHKDIPRDARVKAYHNQMYLVSRDIIRQHSHVEYIRAYNIITARPDVCHLQGVEWDDKGNVLPMTNAATSPNVRISQGFAMELLFHFLVGSQPLEMENDRPNLLCEICRPQSECPGGPCIEAPKEAV